MTFMNNNANIKQFQLIKFINENCDDDHVISKISIVLRPDNGVIHAMDILNHVRRHNLTGDTYNEIKSLIIDNGDESDQVKISKNDEQLKIVLMSKNDDELRNLFENYQELFDKIDALMD